MPPLSAATLLNAHELILLKSTDWPESDLGEAGRSGIVDSYFADALCQAPSTMRVRLVNMRR